MTSIKCKTSVIDTVVVVTYHIIIIFKYISPITTCVQSQRKFNYKLGPYHIKYNLVI